MPARLGEGVLTSTLALIYWIYSRFWLIERVREPVARRPRLYAHWHGDELVLVAAFAQRGMAVMASRSRDGERMARLLAWFGYFVVRGSSSRGGAGGLKGLIDAVRYGGREAALAVDGPRGPRGKVKPGIVKLAQETGSELVPGGVAANRRFVFKKSWNQCYLPLPFSRCVVVYGDPISVPPDASEDERERIRLRLEHSLTLLKAEAENWITAYRAGLLISEPQ